MVGVREFKNNSTVSIIIKGDRNSNKYLIWIFPDSYLRCQNYRNIFILHEYKQRLSNIWYVAILNIWSFPNISISGLVPGQSNIKWGLY